jgi:ketosteroid isomerase-like protein
MRIKNSLACFALLNALAVSANAGDAAADQVRSAEQAFAATMAARDHDAFSHHIADDAVFFDGDKAIRGKAAVVAAWKAFFERTSPPFSWTPEYVEVLDSGALAHSSGPIFNPEGKRVGTFNSVWRRDSDGAWRVVFDKGCNACDCAKKEAAGAGGH